MDSFISRYEGIRYSHLLAVILIVQGLFYPLATSALPVFARQTGQNCVACHAGGQFPELTSYGRLFKLTGYMWGISARLTDDQINGLAAYFSSQAPLRGSLEN
jgi:cytochrome c553